jgi:hypothetical protein
VKVQRLDAELVSAGDESVLEPVPDDEPPHAVESAEARGPPQNISRKNDLGVGVALEDDTLRLQLQAQFFVVVDLSVVDQRIPIVIAQERLATGFRQVEDA